MRSFFKYLFSIFFGLGPIVVAVIFALLIFEASKSIFIYPISAFILFFGFRLGLMTYKKSLEMGPWNLYCYIDASPELDNLKPVIDPDDILVESLISDDDK